MSLTLLVAAALAGTCPPFVKVSVGGDYYDAEHAQGLTVVEQYHFTPNVEALARGQTGLLGGDIGYTLEHFPNHPRALAAMARLALRTKTGQVPGAQFSVECYFQRALEYRPSDGAARALYGAYLMALKRDADAARELQAAVDSDPANAAAWYNLGLVQVRRKDLASALAAAHKAYALGFALPGLRRQLEAANAWQEPPSLDAVVAH